VIVSHLHRFIFIKTNKTAGTSIEAALSQLCGPQDILTPFREDNEWYRRITPPQNYRIDHPLKPKRSLRQKLFGRPERYYHATVGYYEHMPAWRVKAYLGEEVWRSYFKFAFDRNPWDRQVSWYFYKTKSKSSPPPFDDFLASKRRAYVNNYELYTIHSDLAVDFVGRYERLENDFAKALEFIGVRQSIALPRTNVSTARERDYRAYYSPRTKAVVADWYAPEIAMFGYRF
jgi:hypothetical protein